MNIALISPSRDAYSETFIRAHKENLKGKVFYYYGATSDLILEGQGPISNSVFKNYYKLDRKVNKKPYSYYYDKLLSRSFKKNKIQVVLAEYGPTANKFLRVIIENELPLIVHFHGYDASRKSVINQNERYSRVFEYATYIIAVSKKMVDELLKLGCPNHKLIYNPCSADPQFSQINPKFSINQFLAAGRFVDKKAPYYTILAFSKVVRKFPNTTLIMAGNGELKNTCKNLSKYYGLQEKVIFPGVISPEQFRVYLEESLAFVQHSITADDGDSEGTPVAIMEASAAGLPVISTFHAGIPDVIENGQTGFLVDEHDVNGMAVKMIQLLENNSLARQLGMAGKKRLRDNFSMEKHIDVLNELIAKSIKA
ncbi:glycosyltransferase [Pontixanthobacter gangjinensis]|uniref:Colanic acid biosynthesis glycosyltransferase WcaL n=1 Tax=Christiangramia aestuarii TaxID=1028746 RepID=A0A7K1LMP5_9FLAO|nr:glycosyltransferase [Christiangramia aestuarii]MUP41790.1 colanic acid biosynthesis glycosyltransferase WcaL [Christiangramia aestuarii]